MHKKHFLIVFIVVVILVFFLMLWKENLDHKNNNTSIQVFSNYSSDISLRDGFPMNDTLGKNISFEEDNSTVQGYYEFEINSEEDTNYEIFAIEKYYNRLIHPNYIKVYLTDENNNPIDGFDSLSVPTFYDLTVSSLNPAGRRLYYGHLKAGETKKYIFRSWVGDAYSISPVERNFGIKIFVEAD